ncbi:MAG: hypothetical protein LAQ69_13235 [Acidobacteriia bacterium]|nr:hypothetical protein [Terriglobia bacterium]
MQIRNVFLCALAAAGAIAAAELPYAGKWKMNPAKSDFGGTTVTYESLPSGEWQSTAEGNSYKFRLDEKDYPDGLGDTAAWKSIDANTWQTTWKLNGKVLTTDTLKLGADGSSLVVNTKGTKPNGDAIDGTATFQRVSGGPGLAGKWKTKNVKSSSPGVLELVPSGSDGLSFKEPDMGLACDGKLDGKDYSCTGPTLPPGWTVAMTKAGARSLALSVKKDGKPFYKVTYTVAADGKTMTEAGGATATNEKIKIVYDRQ